MFILTPAAIIAQYPFPSQPLVVQLMENEEPPYVLMRVLGATVHLEMFVKIANTYTLKLTILLLEVTLQLYVSMK